MSMRPAALGLVLLLVGGLAQGGPSATVTVHSPGTAEATVDLNALCESLLRSCDSLDPASFGMIPLDTVMPGEKPWSTLSEEEQAKLHARILGVKAKLHVEAEAGWDEPDGGNATATQVPCADAPACPDLLVDPQALAISVRQDVRTFADTSCAVAEGTAQPGLRKLLRFDFVSPNMGEGDLEVGRPTDHLEWFEWGACHEHWHFAEYADYRLWTLPGYAMWQAVRASHPGVPPEELFELYPELRDEMVGGHKQGFCVIDLVPWQMVAVPPRQFRFCTENQGITVGWADKYSLFLDGQWIDVTDVPVGAYVLEAEVNPERLYAESDYSNNASAVLVAVR